MSEEREPVFAAPNPHEWVEGGTGFFGAMGGLIHFKMCVRCGVRLSVSREEYERLRLDENSHGGIDA